MDWGLLSGIGDGMSKLGSWKMEQDEEKRKEKLQQTLEDQREERAQKRYDPSQDKMVQQSEEGGNLWYKVKYNKAGEEIGRELAAKNEIEGLEADRKKVALGDRLLTAQVTDTERKVSRGSLLDSREDEEYNRLSPEEKRKIDRIKGGLDTSASDNLSASTSIQNALTRSSSSSSSDTDNQPTMTEYAKNVLDQFPELESKYGGKDGLPPEKLIGAVTRVIRAFKEVGKKPTQADFDSAINAMYKIDVTAKSPASKSISTSMKGG